MDAICINQEDVQERGEQVQRMPLIYRSAAHLWIWLGNEGDDSAYAIDTLRWWNSKVNVNLNRFEVTMKDSDDRDTWMASRWVRVDFGQRELSSFQTLFDRPWFERTWIQQEVNLSVRGATVVCGHQTMPWQDFFAAFLVIGWHYEEGLCAGKDSGWLRQRAGFMEGLSWSARQRHVQKLLEMLMDDVRHTKCEDPRDKVFGVLGMLSDEDAWMAQHLQPDYTADVEELYKRVSRLCLGRQWKSLEILRHCESGSDAALRSTWAAHWRRPKTAINPVIEQYADACAVAVDVKICDDTLYAQGVVCDSVDAVKQFSNAINELSDIEEAVRTINATLLERRDTSRRREMLSATIHSLSQDVCRDHLSGYALPVEAHLDGYKTTFRLLLERSYGMHKPSSNELMAYQEVVGWFCSLVKSALNGRSLAKTTDGRVGLTPLHTQAGDVLAVLLGLTSVLVLRPQANRTFAVVGICCVHGLNWGEGLLGPLDETKWKFERTTDTDKGDYLFTAFRNLATDTLSVFDPRIDWDGLAVSETDRRRDLLLSNGGRGSFRRPDADYFIRHGVPLQTIAIV